MSDLSDEELARRYQAQPDSAPGRTLINELFSRHHARVAAWCFRMTGNRESAADLAQDIFLKAFRHISSFRGDSKFTTWLYTIARNHCMSEIRSLAARPEATGDTEFLNLPDPAEAADLVFDRQASEQLFRKLMQEALDETERRVMTLHYADELPLDAITRLLGLRNPSGAKAYIVSARRKLAGAIDRAKQLREPAAIREVRHE